MLRELKISNFAIIDDLAARFDAGLNVLTGETGAGKSIIVDALGIALGGRAQADFVRSGEKEATVQAFFEYPEGAALPDIGIDLSEGILVRRIISSAGKSRAYLNDTLVTIQTLSTVGNALVDLMSQHEHQSLLVPDKQRMFLDAFGKLQHERDVLAACFTATGKIREECAQLRIRAQDRAHRIDLLRFQVREIEEAGLAAGEKQALEEERKLLVHMNRLNELTEGSYGLLYAEEGSCTEKLAKAIEMLREMSRIDSSMTEALSLLESALPQVEDAALGIRDAKGRYDLDPSRLEIVEDRLELIKKLEKKYGDGIEGIISYRENAVQELELLEHSDEQLAQLEQELAIKEAELLAAASDLSGKRLKTARRFEKEVVTALRDLAFDHAAFRIEITRETESDGRPKIAADGMDHIEFLLSANPGEPLRPLAKIASGGELSRVMLALKSILAGMDQVPVLIFDEVDAGIGGKTAEAVGKKLRGLADKHQLLCITHLAQIARHGHLHLKIEKHRAKNRVAVAIRELSGREREDEIARMLSGEITDVSRKHAGELLGRTG